MPKIRQEREEDLVRLYLDEIGRYQLLTKDDEARLGNGAVDYAMIHATLGTVFGWSIHVGADSKPNMLRNYPMQGNGAEMLRLACCLATENGIRVCAPVHDAVLVEGPLEQLEEVVRQTQEAMAEASGVVLGGFQLRSDAQLIRHPDRYMDARGKGMWTTVWQVLEEMSSSSRLLEETCYIA